MGDREKVAIGRMVVGDDQLGEDPEILGPLHSRRCADLSATCSAAISRDRDSPVPPGVSFLALDFGKSPDRAHRVTAKPIPGHLIMNTLSRRSQRDFCEPDGKSGLAVYPVALQAR